MASKNVYYVTYIIGRAMKTCKSEKKWQNNEILCLHKWMGNSPQLLWQILKSLTSCFFAGFYANFQFVLLVSFNGYTVIFFALFCTLKLFLQIILNLYNFLPDFVQTFTNFSKSFEFYNEIITCFVGLI